MHDLPLISVIIPTKNRMDLLPRAISSIANQHYDHTEVIVVDDGSNEPVSEEELKYITKYLNVTVIRNVVSLGGARSRNIGVENSSGKYICFLDDDDIYLPAKLSILYDALITNPNYLVVFGKTLLNDGTNKSYPVKYPKVFNPLLNFQLGNFIHTSGTLIHRKVFESTRFNEVLSKYQDTQFHLELTQKHSILFVNEDVSEWSVDGRNDQITFNETAEKRVKSYTTFLDLMAYFEEKLKTPEYKLAYFRFYACIFQLRTGDKRGYIQLIKLLMNPARFYNISKVIFKRRKYMA